VIDGKTKRNADIMFREFSIIPNAAPCAREARIFDYRPRLFFFFSVSFFGFSLTENAPRRSRA
jgi:hypothetical protein